MFKSCLELECSLGVMNMVAKFVLGEGGNDQSKNLDFRELMHLSII